MKKMIKLGLESIRYKNVRNAWAKRHQKTFNHNTDLQNPVPEQLLKEHIAYWKPLRKAFSTDTFKICYALSGVEDPSIVPEELYQGFIEPKLRQTPYATFFAHKSLYPNWHAPELFPLSIGHKIDGQYYNNTLMKTGLNSLVNTVMDYNGLLILKPNRDTYGGSGVEQINCKEMTQTELKNKLQHKPDFVLQEKIQQHASLAQYHPKSLNTIRVHVMKHPHTHDSLFLHAAFRVGCGGGLDNLSAGGLVSFIDENGSLCGRALDKYAKVYTQHPDTQLKFDKSIPDFEGLKQTAKKIIDKLFYLQIVGLDLTYTEAKEWKVIEINTQAQSIRFAQYAGTPFFGKQTDLIKKKISL